MAAVLFLARAELRARWRTFVVLGVLAGIVCGTVLGAHRTGTAFDRLRDRTSDWRAELVGVPPERVPNEPEGGALTFGVVGITRRAATLRVAPALRAE